MAIASDFTELIARSKGAQLLTRALEARPEARVNVWAWRRGGGRTPRHKASEKRPLHLAKLSTFVESKVVTHGDISDINRRLRLLRKAPQIHANRVRQVDSVTP